MSDHSAQPDPKEAIEAQLCAYLEGDLSESERGAIEQHLAGNPPHQQLLAELALTREWLRALPKESAPADVGEAFQQQVERSLLLGEESSQKPRRASGRFPQFALMAALVLLTVGLGTGLMLMLAGPNRQGAKLADNRPVTQSPAASPIKSAAPLDSPATQPEPPAPASPAFTVANADAVPPFAKAMRPMAIVPPTLNATPGGGAEAATAGTASVPMPAQSIHVRVVTADPAAVDGVLTRNGLSLESVHGAALASRQNRRVVPGTQYVANEQLNASQQNAISRPRVDSNSQSPSDSLLDGHRRYVARALTAAQTKQLTDDLNAAAGPGQVTVTARDAAAVVDQSPITVGELVTVVIPQLNGPGMEQTNAVHVGADGKIELPMIEPIPAAGATKDVLARRIADSYRQSNLIANPIVTVVTTVAPASQPISAMQAVTVDVDTTPAQTPALAPAPAPKK